MVSTIKEKKTKNRKVWENRSSTKNCFKKGRVIIWVWCIKNLSLDLHCGGHWPTSIIAVMLSLGRCDLLIYPFQEIWQFCTPQGTFGTVWRHFLLSKLWRVCEASIGWSGAEMLFNILQCTGQLPKTKNYPAPNVNGTKLRNTMLNLQFLKLQFPGWTHQCAMAHFRVWMETQRHLFNTVWTISWKKKTVGIL